MKHDCPSLELGVFWDEHNVYYFSSGASREYFHIDHSSDGLNFSSFSTKGRIIGRQKKNLNILGLSHFRIVRAENLYLLTFIASVKGKKLLYIAYSNDLIVWRCVQRIPSVSQPGILNITLKTKQPFTLFFGGSKLKTATSSDFKKWRIAKHAVHIEKNEKDKIRVLVANLFYGLDDCYLVCFYLPLAKKNQKRSYQIKSFIVSHRKTTHRQTETIWQSPPEWYKFDYQPIGIVCFKQRLISYWQTENGMLMAIEHSYSPITISSQNRRPSVFSRLLHNPLLNPRTAHGWESQAVFNPAALLANNKVHLVYRAIGDRGISVLGYASSQNGINFDQRLAKPIYTPTKSFEGSRCAVTSHYRAYSPYQSGGGWGGCEDPRLTKIDNRIYMTYIAYDGTNPPRIAITSIAADDFSHQQWNWKEPVLISRPNVVDKNACILPQKVNGKFVIFHRIFPNILIDFVDSLDFDGKTWLKGEYSIPPRQECWDSRKVGIGPPPLKTNEGWLTFYHAVDDRDPSRYKIGAMLLDLNDPTKVIHRSTQPLIEPTENYENEGHKFGVVYPCGSVMINKQVFLYYGGSDRVVCGAVASLPKLLTYLKSPNGNRIKPTMAKFLPIIHD